ncbi:hypothetical protein [Saezia sanguinis]|uniref:hypothetical protein n=1 Tax=Saezia sanguinis TaxID=1965230 RepID=UPI003069DECB
MTDAFDQIVTELETGRNRIDWLKYDGPEEIRKMQEEGKDIVELILCTNLSMSTIRKIVNGEIVA